MMSRRNALLAGIGLAGIADWEALLHEWSRPEIPAGRLGA
jgi:hypothetical protein